jgi:hypothetical protein
MGTEETAAEISVSHRKQCKNPLFFFFFFFPHAKCQLSHPCDTTGKFSSVHINLYIFIFLDCKREDWRFWTEWFQIFPKFNMLFIARVIFTFVIPKFVKLPHFQRIYYLLLLLWFCTTFWSQDMTCAQFYLLCLDCHPYYLLVKIIYFSFWSIVFVFAHFTDITSVYQRLVCPIPLQSIPVYMNS